MKTFEPVSIRGRMAYGLKCIEIVLQDRPLHDSGTLRVVLDCMWEATHTRFLDEWHWKMVSVLPDYFEEDEEIEGDEDWSFDFLNELKRIYQSLPAYIPLMIDRSAYMIIDNMSKKISGAEPVSLHLLNEIQAAMIENGHALPVILDLHTYSFSELAGWGRSFTRAEFLRGWE